MNNLKVLIPTILILLVGIGLCFTTMTKNDKKETKKTTTTKEVEVYTTIVMEINPRLALELDKNKIVINMYPLNEDANNFNRDKYKSLTLEDAIKEVINDAKDYLEDNKKITISVTDDNTIKTEDIKEIITDVNEKIKVEAKELATDEINDIKEVIKDLKNDIITTTTTTTTTEASEDNTSTTTTTKKKSDNNDLASLSAEGITINFKKNTTTYEATVDYKVKSIKISAKTDDSKAKVTGTGTKSLDVGDNSLKVKVTAEDKSTKTYTIKIKRRAQYNLNDNIQVDVSYGITVGHYTYPTVEACIGQNPYTLAIPEGKTYDEYCGNKVTIKSYPDIKGNGYLCTKSSHIMGDDGIGMTTSAAYGCNWIVDVADEKEMNNKISKILEAGGKNPYNVGGGLGSGDKITLDEAACKKHNVTCDRW